LLTIKKKHIIAISVAGNNVNKLSQVIRKIKQRFSNPLQWTQARHIPEPEYQAEKNIREK